MGREDGGRGGAHEGLAPFRLGPSRRSPTTNTTLNRVARQPDVPAWPQSFVDDVVARRDSLQPLAPELGQLLGPRWRLVYERT